MLSWLILKAVTAILLDKTVNFEPKTALESKLLLNNFDSGGQRLCLWRV